MIYRAGKIDRDWRPQRMSEAELVAFVDDVLEARVYLSCYVKPETDIGAVFPAMGCVYDMAPEAVRLVGMWYEHTRLRTGTTMLGNPNFQTVKILHREDWLRAQDLIAAAVVQRGRTPS